MRSPLGNAFRWSFVGFAVSLVIALATICLWLRNPQPMLTREAFDSAYKKWEDSDVADYDVEVEVQGRQPATYRVEVRNNRVVRALRNGYPLKQRRTHGTWSVPGMFGTIEIDLENVEAIAGKGTGKGTGKGKRTEVGDGAGKLLLRAAFDPQYGYPSYYHRGQFGGDDVVWRVRRFVVRRPRTTSTHVSPSRSSPRSPCYSSLRSIASRASGVPPTILN